MKAAFLVRLSKSVHKDIRRLPESVLIRIDKRIQDLAFEPLPADATALKGYAHVYRIRIGNYRLIYEVGTTIRIVMILRIGHRKDVYRLL